MSTKTTFKRVALVAVAALGLGTMSVVPATAATSANATYTAQSLRWSETVALTIDDIRDDRV